MIGILTFVLSLDGKDFRAQKEGNMPHKKRIISYLKHPMKPLTASLLIFFVCCASPAYADAAESKQDWQSEWEKTIQGARKDGKLSLYLYQGEGELGAVAQLFQKKYPEISVTTVIGRGNQLGPKVMAERRAGKFLVDAYIAGLTSTYEILYRGKILDSVRSALILPGVLDESKWWQGQHHYIDPENKYIFVFVGNVGQYISYHTKSVDPGEFRSYWDFLQPKWKGKILSRDPKISGSQRIGLRIFYYTPELGAEFIRRLYGDMDITVTQELRQATDWLANGKFAICFFCSEVLKAKFQGLPVDEFPAVRWKESRAISAGNVGSLALPSQPPHPHAARLFANWLLSREGQTAFQRAANTPTKANATNYYFSSSQGDDSRRGKTHRRREVYSGRQVGVYGYGADLRNLG